MSFKFVGQILFLDGLPFSLYMFVGIGVRMFDEALDPQRVGQASSGGAGSGMNELDLCAVVFRRVARGTLSRACRG